jgi:hypothetical protein
MCGYLITLPPSTWPMVPGVRSYYSLVGFVLFTSLSEFSRFLITVIVKFFTNVKFQLRFFLMTFHVSNFPLNWGDRQVIFCCCDNVIWVTSTFCDLEFFRYRLKGKMLFLPPWMDVLLTSSLSRCYFMV